MNMSIAFRLEMKPDRIIRGDLYPAQTESRGTLIICHGFKGFKDWGMFPYVAEQLSRELDVITFNFTHNGVGERLTEFTELEKFAKNTFSRELEDLDYLVQSIQGGTFLVEQNVSASPLFLLGHSRGGGVSLVYGFDHPDRIAGVIAWNGAVDLGGIFSDEMRRDMRRHGRTVTINARTNQEMPLDVEILDDLERNESRFNLIRRTRSVKLPIVLIQGTEDHPRLRDGSAQLVESNPAIEWVNIEGGNHTFNAVHPFQGTTEPLQEAIAETKRFIDRQL